MLLSIEITDYRYKDVVAHGGAPFKKVIAQQVEKVFPQAVKKQTGEVPDVYKLATIKDGWIVLATDLKQGERVKLIADEAQGVDEVLEVRGGAFRTDFKSATGKVFVYGREVKDFRNVDYDAIAMLNVSATQEMQREIDSLQTTLNWQQKRLGGLKKEEQSQLAALRSENAKLRAENTANAKRLATLETRDKEREARFTRLEISMPAARPVANTIASNKRVSSKMKAFLTSVLLLALVLATSVHAGPRSSANYTDLTDTMDTGGLNAQSANYSLRGSAVGEFGTGTSAINTSAAYTNKPGYVGQLSDLLTLAVSRLTHGGAGTFNINLPLSGQAGVECRNSSIYTVVFTFANPLTARPA